MKSQECNTADVQACTTIKTQVRIMIIRSIIMIMTFIMIIMLTLIFMLIMIMALIMIVIDNPIPVQECGEVPTTVAEEVLECFSQMF